MKLQDFSQVPTTLFDDEVTHSNHTNYEDNDETEYPHCNEFHSPHHEGPHEGLFQREVIQKILNEMDELASENLNVLVYCNLDLSYDFQTVVLYRTL